MPTPPDMTKKNSLFEKKLRKELRFRVERTGDPPSDAACRADDDCDSIEQEWRADDDNVSVEKALLLKDKEKRRTKQKARSCRQNLHAERIGDPLCDEEWRADFDHWYDLIEQECRADDDYVSVEKTLLLKDKQKRRTKEKARCCRQHLHAERIFDPLCDEELRADDDYDSIEEEWCADDDDDSQDNAEEP